MATSQVMLSLAAIHTMSDMLTQVLYDLCTRQDLIQALRQEVISVQSNKLLNLPTIAIVYTLPFYI